MNLQEARAEWSKHRPIYERKGLSLPHVSMYLPDGWKEDAGLAMDAQPNMVTDPNSALPAMLTTAIDPEVIRVIFAPNMAAEIFTERRVGDWLEETRMFPVIEATGEVSSYGDFNNNGRAGVNMNWPNFQSYLWQTKLLYGERELERAGLGKINYVSELNVANAMIHAKYANLTYFFGVTGLQNYGALNNPYLSASLTPATKAAGGVTWFNGNNPNATANEVYNDIIAIYQKLISQTYGAGLDQKSKMTLAMSPSSAVALTFTNSFGVNVEDLLKKNFPNMQVKTAAQYGASSSSNSQGQSGGNLVQLIADNIEGQKVAYCAFNEKMRAHKIIALASAWEQKTTGGTWGTIMRMPVGIASMIGV